MVGDIRTAVFGTVVFRIAVLFHHFYMLKNGLVNL